MDNSFITSLALSLYDWGAFEDKTGSSDGKGYLYKHHEVEMQEHGRVISPLAPYRLNIRTPANKNGTLTPLRIIEIGIALYELVKEHEIYYDGICGIPLAGEPIALAFATAATIDGWNIPIIQLKKEQSSVGRRIVGPPEGIIKDGYKVLLFDDLVNRAKTKIEAATALREAGLVVNDLAVVLDGQMGGREILESEYRLFLHAALTRSEFFEACRSHNRITQEQYKEYVAYEAP